MFLAAYQRAAGVRNPTHFLRLVAPLVSGARRPPPQPSPLPSPVRRERGNVCTRMDILKLTSRVPCFPVPSPIGWERVRARGRPLEELGAWKFDPLRRWYAARTVQRAVPP